MSSIKPNASDTSPFNPVIQKPTVSKRKQTQAQKECPVKYLALLNEKEGSTKVGQYLGLSSSAIQADLNRGKTRKAYELAAKQIFTSEYGSAERSMRVAIVKAQPKILQDFDAYLKIAGGTLMLLPESVT